MLSFNMPSIIMLNVLIESVDVLTVITTSVFTLSIILLSDVAPSQSTDDKKIKKHLNAIFIK